MAELPGGTVTQLFTDVEGSTRTARQLGKRFVVSWWSTIGCLERQPGRAAVTRLRIAATAVSGQRAGRGRRGVRPG